MLPSYLTFIIINKLLGVAQRKTKLTFFIKQSVVKKFQFQFCEGLQTDNLIHC